METFPYEWNKTNEEEFDDCEEKGKNSYAWMNEFKGKSNS